MIAGHTKFAPDWCFGLLKQKYRNTHISNLTDLSNTVTASTVKGINIPQLAGTEDGTVIVDTYNWHKFLEPHFMPLPALKKVQHFRFSADHPGTVFYRVRSEDPEQAFNLMRSSTSFPVAGDLQASDPPGLPVERQWYLYNKIREFVRPYAKDSTCPRPKNSLPPKFGTKKQDHVRHRSRDQNAKFRKFKMADDRHFENGLIAISQPIIICFE